MNPRMRTSSVKDPTFHRVSRVGLGMDGDWRRGGNHWAQAGKGFKRLVHIFLMMQVVLFVCVENTFRSVLSEAIFNSRAPPGWRAESAGVQPAAAINPVVVELLREIDIEIGPKVPRLVTSEMISNARWVITFGCLDRCPPGIGGKSEDWPVSGATDKTTAQLRAIRDDLSRRIDALIREIEKHSQA